MSYAQAFAVNDNGTVVVGCSNDKAFRWKEGSTMDDLGVLTGYNGSEARGVNSDGTVVVGSSYAFERTITGPFRRPRCRAFRWKEGRPTAMEDLGVLEGDNRSEARGVNSDGTIVVGSSYASERTITGPWQRPRWRAFRWKEGKEEEPSVMEDLGVLEGDDASEARGVNSDGTVVVGISYSSRTIRHNHPFRWKEGQGMQALPTFPEYTGYEARAVSNDGTIIVGWCNTIRRRKVLAIVWDNRRLFCLGDSPLTNDQFRGAYGITSPCSSISSSIVGYCGDQAARWKNGIHFLGKLYDDDNPIIARATCMNGTIIVGDSGNHAFRWKEGRTPEMEDLGHL